MESLWRESELNVFIRLFCGETVAVMFNDQFIIAETQEERDERSALALRQIIESSRVSLGREASPCSH